MRTTIRTMALVLCVPAIGGGVLSAQDATDRFDQRTAWDAPSFLPPRPEGDLGLYVFDPADGDFGVAGIWRQSGNLNLGVRLGVASGTDETAVLFGGEFYGPLLTTEDDAPLDVSWVLGAGATVDGGTLLRIPAGVVAGREFAVGRLRLVPYVHPRLGFDVFAIGDESETDIVFTADIGLDVILGRSWLLRVGAALGDHDAFGAGVAYRMGRRAAVR